jgi:FkbM family methyltransferase
MKINFLSLNRPEYFFNPKLFVKRIFSKITADAPHNSYEYKLPFKGKIKASGEDVIGKSLFSYGIYDLIESETMWRLLDKNDNFIDIGANIGYTSLLASRKISPHGNIFLFEPSPSVLPDLKYNLFELNQVKNATLFEHALGNENGEVKFRVNEVNSGESMIVKDMEGDHIISVVIKRLDDVIDLNLNYKLLKIDVEGFEHEVLKGAHSLLSSGNVENIIYEDHALYPSDVSTLLESYGYDIYLLKKNFFGPSVTKDLRDHTSKFEPPNYIATKKSESLKRLIKPGGWKILKATDLNR